MKKILLVFLLSLFVFSFLAIDKVDAQTNVQKDVVIVNPIRGEDFWDNNFGILDVPKKQYDLISKNNLKATWIVRYDALKNPEVINFLKTLNKNQEVGLFLEITPTLAKEAGVTYNQSPNWHYPESAFLSGYSQEDRKKLIDTAVKQYKDIFGINPQSVGAWWIDAYSLDYLKQKYGIIANLDVADQFSTDQYQVWGQYFSTPFYPSKTNALIPAQSPDKKLGVVTMQWATRDPFNSYGNGVDESTYSVQVNDYFLHKLNENYFAKLLNIYPQTTVGLENDFSWNDFGNGYQKQLGVIIDQQKRGTVKSYTMADYARSYMAANLGVSPKVIIAADDPLNTGGKVVWYLTPKYRVGWFYNKDGSSIRDLRIYNDSSEEPCFKLPCKTLDLEKTFVNAIDDVTYKNQWVIDEGKISNIAVTPQSDGLKISYTNQSGNKREIKFLDNDISVDGKVTTLESAILSANLAKQNLNKEKIVGQINNQINFLSNTNNILINAIKFIIFSFLFFFLPGLVLIKRYDLSLPVGWVIFTLLTYFLGFVNLRVLLWLVPLVSLGVLFFQRPARPNIHYERVYLPVIILVIIGSLSWLMVSIKNGLMYPFGLGFWGPNGHDGIWHLALISELQRNIFPQNPVFSGEALKNYHYFFDLLIAQSGLMFGMDIQELLFRLFPICFAFLAGILIYKFVYQLSQNKAASFFAVFFLYFGGSFGWILSFIKDKTFGGESMFWSQQAISTLLNPPYAISLVILFAGMILLYDLVSKKTRNYKLSGFCLILLFGSVIEFKVYAGVLALAGLGIVTLVLLIKRNFTFMIVGVASLILSLLVFLPNNLSAGGLLVFSPLWLVNSMIDFPDRLGWHRLALAKQAYGATGNISKLFFAEGAGLIIFLLGNFGTRIIGIFSIKKVLAKNIEVGLFLITILLVGIIFPLLFIQKGTNWNIIQFFYYAQVILGIFAGLSLGSLWTKRSWKWGLIISVIIILLTVPTTWDTLNQYLPANPPAKLSYAELEALNFLKNQPQGVVMTLPFDEKKRDFYEAPMPLVAYAPTGYVAAFSNKPSFLEDTINLDILGTDYKGRLNEVKDFLKFKERAPEILAKGNVQYIYVVKDYSNFEEDEQAMGIKKIFDNNQVKIFKVQ
jgi:hypothetical protein